MGIKELMINFAVVGLLVFSLMTFIVITQEDNSVENNIRQNDLINQTYNELEDNLLSGDAQSQYENFGNNSPTERQLGELNVVSVISVTKLVRSISLGLWNIFVKLPSSVLGVSPIVITILGSLFLISLVLGAWAIWKGVMKA